MSEHSVLLAVQRQVQGLVAERDGLRVTLEAARKTLDMWRRAYLGDGEVQP